MKRREFVERLGMGSAAALVAGGAGAIAASTGAPAPRSAARAEPAHDHRPVRDPLAAATVNFGSWRSDVPLDRFPNVSPAVSNAHLVMPYVATIKSGGSVAFATSGLHHVIVYGPGTRLEDVNPNLTRPSTGTPAGTPLINDPSNRIYAGLDPSTQPRDRVEVVRFPEVPGRYLVICGVQPHFVTDQMHGWVRVRPEDDDN